MALHSLVQQPGRVFAWAAAIWVFLLVVSFFASSKDWWLLAIDTVALVAVVVSGVWWAVRAWQNGRSW
jgi:hypothetical protein